MQNTVTRSPFIILLDSAFVEKIKVNREYVSACQSSTNGGCIQIGDGTCSLKVYMSELSIQGTH